MDLPSKVLVFEAHSDDTVIGMGGLVRKLSSHGVEICVCTVTKGETAHTEENVGDIVQIRQDEGKQADEVLGISEHIFLDHGCQDVRNERSTFHEFVKLIREQQPDIIFTHGSHEWHRDHRAISALTEEAWWKATEHDVLPELGKPFKANAVVFYEVIPMFTSNPDVCIDVTKYWNSKKDAIRCFTSQMNTMQEFEGLVDGKGLYRGYLIGCKYAEAFIFSKFLPRTTF